MDFHPLILDFLGFMLNGWDMLRAKSYINFRTQSVIMSLAGSGVIANNFWKLEKLSNFEVYAQLKSICAGEASVDREKHW